MKRSRLTELTRLILPLAILASTPALGQATGDATPAGLTPPEGSTTGAEAEPVAEPSFLGIKKFELTADAVIQERSHIKRTDESFRLGQYELQGQAVLKKQFPIPRAIDVSLLRLDLDTPNDLVPEELIDLSAEYITPIAQFENGWYLGGRIGAGYAGEKLGDYSDGYYGKATLIVGRQLDKTSSILVALGYDGNRAIFPDLPLPFIAYTKLLRDPQLELVAGFPFTTVRYRPTKQWLFEATATIGTIAGRIEYNLTENVQLYGFANDVSRAFRLDDLPNHDRLFFEQNRAEAGVVLKPRKDIGITLAGGYAFNQEFSTGFDTRETVALYKPADAAYARIGLEWKP
jgi:hypothetical protein